MVKLVLIIRDVEKEGDGILYDAAEFVRFSDSQREKKKILRFSVQSMSLILGICLKPFRLEQQVFICSMSKLSVTERITE